MKIKNWSLVQFISAVSLGLLLGSYASAANLNIQFSITQQPVYFGLIATLICAEIIALAIPGFEKPQSKIFQLILTPFLVFFATILFVEIILGGFVWLLDKYANWFMYGYEQYRIFDTSIRYGYVALAYLSVWAFPSFTIAIIFAAVTNVIDDKEAGPVTVVTWTLLFFSTSVFILVYLLSDKHLHAYPILGFLFGLLIFWAIKILKILFKLGLAWNIVKSELKFVVGFWDKWKKTKKWLKTPAITILIAVMGLSICINIIINSSLAISEISLIWSLAGYLLTVVALAFVWPKSNDYLNFPSLERVVWIIFIPLVFCFLPSVIWFTLGFGTIQLLRFTGHNSLSDMVSFGITTMIITSPWWLFNYYLSFRISNKLNILKKHDWGKLSLAILFQSLIVFVWSIRIDPILHLIQGVVSGLIVFLFIMVIKISMGILDRIRSINYPTESGNNQSQAPYLFSNDFRDDLYRIPLQPYFRFLHEPISFDETEATSNKILESRFVGRDKELREMIQRILLSDGGAFLITGYRGVGKTSFVNRVIHEIKQNLPWLQNKIGEMDVLDIHLNLARPVTAGELMHYIIRSLYFRLSEKGIFNYLDKTQQEELLLAYQRTSANFTRKLGLATESQMGISDLSFANQIMGFIPKFSALSKKTRTEDMDFSFLAYDDKSAEYDLISLSRKLRRGYTKRQNHIKNFLSRTKEATSTKVQLKIIFIFDELDKLDEYKTKEGQPIIDEILNTLKNLFSASGITFIFIAGKDLHERWLEDVGKGDSVYESVFAYNKYLPAMWSDIDDICKSLIMLETRTGSINQRSQEAYRPFIKYITFRGRGVPRRIIRTFNQHVKWDGINPFLAFSKADIRRFKFYSGLQDALEAGNKDIFGNPSEENQGETQDKRRLGVYYLLDWVFRQGDRIFTQRDAIVAARKLSSKIALTDDYTENLINLLLDNLLTYEYLELIEYQADRVLIQQSNSVPEKEYKIPRRRLLELGNSTINFDDEFGSVKLKNEVADFSQYQLHELIGQGGMSEVFRAWDPNFQRFVAIKILRLVNEKLLIRFMREGKILNQLRHPNIVKFYDYGQLDEKAFLVLEYIDGVELKRVMSLRKIFDLQSSLTIMTPILSAVSYLHNLGIIRLDLKPSNILLDRWGRIVLIDLGIAKKIMDESDTSDITGEGQIIGTPMYMSPEQAMGNSVDGRADIYSIGVILYQLFTGSLPYPDKDTPMQLILSIANTPPIPPTRINPNIPFRMENIILKCLEKKPSDRFSTIIDLVEALPSYHPVDLTTLVQGVTGEIEKELIREDEQTMEKFESKDDVLPNQMSQPILASYYPSTSSPKNEYSADFIERARNITEVGTCLIVEDKENNKEAVYSLVGRSRLSVGRSADNDVILNTEKVSRYHSVLELRGRSWFIKDLNSANGTFVNNNPVQENELQDLDVIIIGDTNCLFRQ
jgi:serine/threonine-protein kinase